LELPDETEDALRVLFAMAVAAAIVKDIDDHHNDMICNFLLFSCLGVRLEAFKFMEGQFLKGIQIGGSIEFAESLKE
jgi:hypothetical protein